MTNSENEKWIGKESRWVDSFFSGKLLETYSSEKIEDYWKRINSIWEQTTLARRYCLSHNTIQSVVANYLALLGWNSKYEVDFADFESSYRFDIMAKKGDHAIVIEVKPEITTKDLGQVLGYVISLKKRYPEARVFLATDIIQFGFILSEGEIKDIILDMAQRYGLGIAFASTDDIWIIPSEFLFV
jgi:hypothetical protein